MKKLNYYRNKKVFITGHTGFKGSWLTRILLAAGAKITGFSMTPPTNPNLFTMADIEKHIHSVQGDVRDIDLLSKVFDDARPEIVFHLAAQPLVRESYKKPAYTYETNVMGTVNILECIRNSDTVESFLNVTTDKVYHNNEWVWGYRECEALDGYDPYSNSKSCSELVTHSYKNSFFSNGPAIATARAGNVIGGGDFSADRIIPDCIRAVTEGRKIIVRNPDSVRPYQHVLEPLFAYLMIACAQVGKKNFSGWYNVGPDECDCVKTGDIVNIFCRIWGDGAEWITKYDGGPHEAQFLKLDCAKIKQQLGWRPTWHIEEAIKRTINWTRTYLEHGDIPGEMDKEISDFVKEEQDATCRSNRC